MSECFCQWLLIGAGTAITAMASYIALLTRWYRSAKNKHIADLRHMKNFSGGDDDDEG